MSQFKINKALDLNKLFNDQRNGKLLKKHISFPMLGSIKYDGNYVVVLVERGHPTFITSGGLTYTHTDGGGDIFQFVPDRAYMVERISGEGKLGDRNSCNLRGSKDAQTSTNHSYVVFDTVSLEDYYDGMTRVPFSKRYETLEELFEPTDLAGSVTISSQDQLDGWLHSIVKEGYEGVMAVSPSWKWKDTKSRKVDMIKYKKRPTVDLLCIGATEGTGKYLGMIGSLRLKDSTGRIVDVGSGMSDYDRLANPNDFIGKVIEMFYEQIVDTYIQPTFGAEYEGVLIRDKTAEEID